MGDHVARAANVNGIRVHPRESGKGGKTIYTNMITTTNLLYCLSLRVKGQNHGENQNCSTCEGWQNVTTMYMCRARRWHVEEQSLLLFPFTFSKLSVLTEIQSTVACYSHWGSINNIRVTHCPHVKHKIVRYYAVGLSHFKILKLLNDAMPMIIHSCLYNTITTDTYLQSLHLLNGIHR